MIVVKVELWSAITGQHTELARMMIANVGGTDRRGDYKAVTYKGRDEETLTRAMLKGGPISHSGVVKNHARLQEHVWNLVAKCLTACGYNAPKPSDWNAL